MARVALRCLGVLSLCSVLHAVLLVPTAAMAQEFAQGELAKLPYKAPTLIAHYGSAPQQVAELRIPAGKGPFPVVVVIHGGCLLASMESMQGTRSLASAITDMGYATWNIEYRALDETGGGWPGTFQDWGTAVDYLRVVAKTQPIRTDAVVTVGHSAGSAGALWLAFRSKLPPESEIRGQQPLPLRGSVDIDGPADLQPYLGLDSRICGQPIVSRLMGGTPDQQPTRFAQATPSQLAPSQVPELLIASQVLPEAFAVSYRDKAKAAGEPDVNIVAVKNGGHFDVIAPGSPVWTEQVQPALRKFLDRTMK